MAQTEGTHFTLTEKPDQTHIPDIHDLFEPTQSTSYLIIGSKSISTYKSLRALCMIPVNNNIY